MERKPLAGVRVLDLTRLLPGNVCTLALALLGADVIKVEDTGAGDYQRSFGTQVEGAGVSHWMFNRGKRSICLDLKAGADRATFEDLVRTSDVLIESFRPGVLERLGYAPAVLQELQPALVIARISGYGGTGPLADSAGHDINYLAFSGHLERLGLAGGPPVMPQVPFADMLGGALLPALLVTAYVQRARRDGVAAVIDASMADAMALMPNVLLCELLAGQPIEPRGETLMGGALACYGVYAAADGHVALGALEERFWRNFCGVAGLEGPELEDHLAPQRQAHLRSRIAAFFATRTRAELECLFAGVDACVSPVLSYEEMLATPQAMTRQYVSRTAHAPVATLEFPAMVDGQRLAVERPAPAQGEQGEEIRAEARALLRARGR